MCVIRVHSLSNMPQPHAQNVSDACESAVSEGRRLVHGRPERLRAERSRWRSSVVGAVLCQPFILGRQPRQPEERPAHATRRPAWLVRKGFARRQVVDGAERAARFRVQRGRGGRHEERQIALCRRDATSRAPLVMHVEQRGERRRRGQGGAQGLPSRVEVERARPAALVAHVGLLVGLRCASAETRGRRPPGRTCFVTCVFETKDGTRRRFGTAGYVSCMCCRT